MVDVITPLPRLTEFVRKYRVPLVMFTPQDVDLSRRTMAGYILNKGGWVKKTLPLPRVVYNRCYPEPDTFIEQLENVIGDGRVFNHVTLFDKWEVYHFLQNTSLERWLPKTYVYSEESLPDLLKKEQDLILKPRLGSLGKRLIRIQQLENNRLFLYHEYPLPLLVPDHRLSWAILATIAPPTEFIAQKFIDVARIENQIFDIRALVQKDATGNWAVTARLSRVAKPHFFITNIYQRIAPPEQVLEQAGFSATKLLAEIETVSLTVANLLEEGFGHLGEISVDFGVDRQGNLWAIEVNGKPDKSLFQDLNDAALLDSVFMNPMRYAFYLGSE